MVRVKDRPNSTSTILRCSFCGKDEVRVDRLIAGPGVFICDRCVALCNQIIEQEN